MKFPGVDQKSFRASPEVSLEVMEETLLFLQENLCELGVQIDSIEQPMKSNSVGSGNMSHGRASSLYDHLDHCFVVFKEIQQSFLTRRMHV